MFRSIEQSNGKPHQPVCRLAHGLINKLSVIVGLCELVSAEAVVGTKDTTRLKVIDDMAKSMARDLTDCQCELAAAIGKVEAELITPTTDHQKDIVA